MSGKAVIPLVAGLCVGGLALKIGIDKIRSAEGAQPEIAHVWVPRAIIPVGQDITEEMVQAVEFPARLIPADAITKKEDLIGRVPQISAPASLPILEAMLAPRGTRPGLYVPKGFRAVAVKIDEGSGVDNHLRPGAWVDVVGYFQVMRNNRRETVARTIIENVEVGAVGPWISPDRKSTSEDGGAAKHARAVTLLVKPEKVPILHLAEQKGKIKLSMRNSNEDRSLVYGAAATEDEVVGGPDNSPREDKSDESAATGALAKFFTKWTDKELTDEQRARINAPEKPQPTEPPVPIVPAEPEPEPYVVVIWNGDVKEVMEFKTADSMDAAAAKPAAQKPRKFGAKNEKPAAEPATPMWKSDKGPRPKDEENAKAGPEPKELRE